MSRRKAFDTTLSSAEPTAGPASTSVSSSSKPQNKSPKKKAAKPSGLPSKPEASVSHNKAPKPSVQPEVVVAQSGADEAGEESLTEEGTCFICAEPITFWSVGVCGHRTCHVCAVRLRTFYKKYECTYCKTMTPSLFFTRSPETPFPADHHLPSSSPDVISSAMEGADKLPKGEKWYKGLTLPGTLDLAEFEFHDDKLGVVFEDEDMMEATLLLLRFNCPAPDCAHMAEDWSSLERHTNATHGTVICRLCRSQLHRFAHEQILYPPHLLPYHDPSRVRPGHKPPRLRNEKELELVKSWEAPHPMCEFCHEAFFGPDELFKHMREKHDECFVCRGLGQRDVYFANYDKLERHFEQDHFPCHETRCLEQKFVVFGSEMDLRAHMITEHKDDMSARDRAQARMLNVGFDSDPRDRRSGRADRHGRGFTMNGTLAADSRARANGPQPQQISQTPTMTPAQAAQQQRQIQTDRQEESRRRKAFVTSLTDGDERQSGPSRVREDQQGGRSGFATPREDVDDASAQKHAALLSRVTLLVNDSSVKLSSFRSAVRQFRNHESSANDMVDTIYHILDRDSDVTVSVVREVASLFDDASDQDMQQSILEALNGFRVKQQEQFPALNVPAGMGSNWAGITSGKILNAKKTTHTSGKGASSRDLWSRVEAAAASSQSSSARPAGTGGRYVPGSGIPLKSNSVFPTLAGPSSSSRPPGHSTPWAGGGAGSSSKSPSALAGPQIRSVNYPTPAASKSKPPSQAAFPSLPATGNKGMTKVEREALFNKPNPRDESIRRIMGGGQAPPPRTDGWSGGQGNLGNGIEQINLDADNAGTVPSTGGGSKKKQKGKQLLFSVSARPS